jgi:hypothetical protein
MDIKERIKAVCQHFTISISAFEKKSGLSNGYVNSIKNSISDKKLEQISKAFPDVDGVWLKMGVGEMLKSNQTLKGNAIVIGEIKIPEDESPYIELGNDQFLMVVPLIPIRASAGYREHYDDENFVNSHYGKHYFPVTRQYRGKYFAFVVDGDSMDDGTSEAIIEGSTVTARDIQRHLWSSKFHLHSFKDFVIVLKDIILVKRIIEHNTTTGTIVCHSLNSDKRRHADFTLHLDECLQILNIVNVTQPR